MNTKITALYVISYTLSILGPVKRYFYWVPANLGALFSSGNRNSAWKIRERPGKTDFFSDKYTQDPYHIETLSHFRYNFPVDFTRDLWVQSPNQMNVHSEHGGG